MVYTFFSQQVAPGDEVEFVYFQKRCTNDPNSWKFFASQIRKVVPSTSQGVSSNGASCGISGGDVGQR